ncbi:hypothetical protein [Nocardia sp. NPDC003726]
MQPFLVTVPWVGSIFFVGVLCFRLGYWWKTTELQGRHAVGNVPGRDDRRKSDEDDLGDEASMSAPPPARPRRWRSDDDDTEVMPVIDNAVNDQ